MKNLLLIAVFASSVGVLTLTAQPTITFEKHALQAGIDNPMSYCSYQDAGVSGENIVWDFKDLEFEKAFTGYLKNSKNGKYGNEFLQSNTSLEEFNSLFYFHVSKDKIEQYGFSSTNGRVMTQYDIPFVKMKYPFNYGDYFSGSFSGATTYSGKAGGVIQGTYDIEADAHGTLVLPGDVAYENTLRVRTDKSYTLTRNDNEQEIEIITYRWYNAAHRYPLLTLTEYTTKSGATSNTNYQAAYNNNAVSNLLSTIDNNLLVYPNPTTANLWMDYHAIAAGKISISILDVSGKVLKEIEQNVTDAGMHKLDLTTHINGLNPASYILLIESNNFKTTKSFTLVE